MDFTDGKKVSAPGFGSRIVKFAAGVAAGTVAAALMTMLAALIMTLDAVPDGTVTVISYVVMAFAAAVCGFVSVASIGSSGMLNGLFAGLVFFSVQTAVGLISGGTQLFSAETLMHAAVDAVFATAGGIAAVNFRK